MSKTSSDNFDVCEPNLSDPWPASESRHVDFWRAETGFQRCYVHAARRVKVYATFSQYREVVSVHNTRHIKSVTDLRQLLSSSSFFLQIARLAAQVWVEAVAAAEAERANVNALAVSRLFAPLACKCRTHRCSAAKLPSPMVSGGPHAVLLSTESRP